MYPPPKPPPTKGNLRRCPEISVAPSSEMAAASQRAEAPWKANFRRAWLARTLWLVQKCPLHIQNPAFNWSTRNHED